MEISVVHARELWVKTHRKITIHLVLGLLTIVFVKNQSLSMTLFDKPQILLISIKYRKKVDQNSYRAPGLKTFFPDCISENQSLLVLTYLNTAAVERTAITST